jgi:hypothetical protein
MNTLRHVIYVLKRKVHENTILYQLLYFIITFNLDYLKQLLNIGKYPSKFGGQWVHRKDFKIILRQKIRKGLIDSETAGLIGKWREDGFVVWKQAIASALVDELNEELNALPAKHPAGLMITGPNFEGSKLYQPELIRVHESIRIVDYYFFSLTARKILFSKPLMDFLEIVFEKKPVLTQSLNFEYGSEQAVHQDVVFAIMNSPLKMAAIWIALEDVQPGSGELVYYPGSHLWPDFLFSGRFKHFDKERDGIEQKNAWHAWLHEEARRRKVELQSFLPKKGDALLWHAGLAHGGAPITTPNKTRRSLVGHYCARGVRPLYHYYKPSQRKFYDAEGFFYSSAYYKK